MRSLVSRCPDHDCRWDKLKSGKSPGRVTSQVRVKHASLLALHARKVTRSECLPAIQIAYASGYVCRIAATIESRVTASSSPILRLSPLLCSTGKVPRAGALYP